jgi:ankyrin repeat protein
MDINEAFQQKNDLAIVTHLQSGYDTRNDPDELLLMAAHYGQVKVLQACINAGIHPDTHAALCWACGKGQITPIEILISAGANPNIRDEFGSTPIVSSASHGKLVEVKYLLKHGAKLDGALIAATHGKYSKLVRFLVEQGADLEEIDSNNLTSLTIACHSLHKKSAEIALFLIDAGANVNYLRKVDEQTPLKFAVRPEVIQALIDRGAAVDGPEGTEQTALMLAARGNNVNAIDVLLRNGANPNLTCNLPWAKGLTAEGLAELEGQYDALEYLRRTKICGVDPH